MHSETATDRVIGTAILSQLKELAAETYRLMTEKIPELEETKSTEFVEKSIRDIEYSILYLSNAISVSSPKIFINYIQWFIDIMNSMSIPLKYLKLSIACLFETLERHFDTEALKVIEPYFAEGLSQFNGDGGASIDHSSLDLSEVQRNVHLLKPYRDRYIKHLLSGERNKANILVQELIKQDFSVEDIYMEIFHEGQHELGKMWQMNQITIAEEHYCTASTQLIMGQLYPLIFATPKNDYVFVGACVGGELHELGVRMVSDFMELSGWNTYYLGANTPVKSIVETIVSKSANVVGISVTMSFHIEEARQIIESIRTNDGCSRVKIIVGGYPFIVDEDLWRTIGADGYAKNARDAVKIANTLVAEVNHDDVRR